MPVYVRSTFSRDDANSLEYADTGEVWEYFGSAPFGIVDNQADIILATNRAVAALPCGAADGWLQASYYNHVAGKTIHALAFRIQDIDNYWYVANLTTAGAIDDTKISLWKRVAGVDTNVGGAVAYTWGAVADTGYGVAVRLAGSALDLYVSGSTTAALSVSDSALSTATKHGFGTLSDSDNQWDNFLFHSFPFTLTSAPVLQVEVAFRRDAADNPMYVDMTNRAFGAFSTRRGRPDELASFEPGTLSGLQFRNDDRALEPEYEGDLVNFVQNGSFETNTTGYTAAASAISRVEVARYQGSYGLKTVTTNTNGSGWFTTTIAVTPGVAYTASVYGRLATAGPKTFELSIDWYNGGVYLSSSRSGSVSLTSTDWTRATVTGTAPPTATQVVLTFWTFAGGQGVFDMWADAVQFEPASAASAYIDGSLPNGRWSGTVHGSWSYRGGPLFGYVLPRRGVRLKLFGFDDWGDPIQGGVIFVGQNDFWPQKWLLKKVQVTTPAISDNLKRVSLSTFSDVRIAELISTRLDAILADPTLNIPENVNQDNARSIATTTRQAQAKTYTHENRLSAAREMEVTEHGRLFANRFGTIIFLKHADELASPYTVSQVTLGDGGGAELPYTDPFLWSDDERYIYNNVIYTRNGGVEQIVSDTTSQGKFGFRPLQKSTQGDADADSLALATLELARHKDPTIRGTVTLQPHRDYRIWSEIKDRELCDRVTVKRRPEQGGVWTKDFQTLAMELQFKIGGSRHLDCEATYTLGPVFSV